MRRRTKEKRSVAKKKVVRKTAPKIKRAVKKPARTVTKKVKVVRQRTAQPKPVAIQPAPVKQFQKELLVGAITHYFTHLSVGVLEITNSELAVGDKIHIQGATTNFTQTVTSMQVDRNPVEKAVKGQSIGLKVNEHVREHDKVYKVEV